MSRVRCFVFADSDQKIDMIEVFHSKPDDLQGAHPRLRPQFRQESNDRLDEETKPPMYDGYDENLSHEARRSAQKLRNSSKPRRASSPSAEKPKALKGKTGKKRWASWSATMSTLSPGGAFYSSFSS